MKSTGMVRKIDELGRLVIPKELRKVLSIIEGDGLEIFVDGSQIILKKYAPGCVICDSMDELTDYKGKKICKTCKEGFHG